MNPKIILKSGKADAVRRFHPWIFSGAIKKIIGNVQNGDTVDVYSNKEDFLATGHYQESSIAVRIISFQQTTIDDNFWLTKLTSAYNYRKRLGLTDNPHTNSYRLVYAEGDSLPGLIMDYYNGTVVIQCHSVGMHLIRNQFAAYLQEVLGDKLNAVYYKAVDMLSKTLNQKIENEYLYNLKTENTTVENDCHFKIDWEKGQKTGFFIDQRENRALLGNYCKDKKVLNTFCYTGGFSVYALKHGASLVHSIDSSAHAIDLTEENIALNNIDKDKHTSFVSDTMEYLNQTEEQYDIIILDPPAYAKHQSAKHNAIQGYKRLNKKALEKIKSGGLLFTFSCSQVVDRRMFNSTVMSAAILTGRKVRIVHELSQAVCHPLNAYHPEGHYLKGLVLYVE